MTFIASLRSRVSHRSWGRPTGARAFGALVLLFVASTAVAAADRFATVADPPQQLGYHTATLLQDGRVLTVGVFGPPAIFDPRSGAWTATVNPPANVIEVGQPTAVLLRDGRVLVAGGYLNGGTYVNTAHLFDPRTNGWTAAASMASARTAMPSVLLSDGRVLVTGGSNGVPLASSEIYDPTADTWSAAASMIQSRSGHSMSWLPDGRVLIAGPDTSEIYDPVSNATSTLRLLSTFRRSIAILLLPNGKVLAAGHNQPPGSATAEEYDPATDTWSLTGPLGATVTGVSLTLLPDGRVLLDGGPLSGPGPTSQFYDPASRVWTNGPTSAPRAQHSATLLADGRVLVAGGNVPTGEVTEIFDGRTLSTTGTASIAGDRASAALVVLNDGRVLMAGGVSGTGTELSTAAVYYPSGDTWLPTPAMSTPRTNGHKALLLRDGRVMVIGGLANGNVLAATDVYNQASNSWASGPSMNVARNDAGTAILSNGWVLAFGGTGVTAGVPIDSTEMYVPDTNRWVPMAPMPAPRRRLTAVRLADDRVLVAGGVTEGSGSAQADAWVFDYRTNTWTATTPMPAGREYAKSALLPDGRAIVVGETGPGGTAATMSYIWDPVTGLWTSAPFTAVTRSGFDLVTLTSGEVAAVGGRLEGTGPTDLVSIFDGTTNAWTTAGSLAAPRHRATVAVLPDGRLLRIGGFDATGLSTTNDTELLTLSRGGGSSTPSVSLSLGLVLNGSTISLSGLDFSSAYASNGSSYATSSATNYPLVWYRSLTTNEQGFLPVDSWSDTNVTFASPGGNSLGPAVLAVRTNGVPSVPQFKTIGSSASSTSLGPVAPVSYHSASQPIPMTATVSSFTADAGRVLFYVDDGAGGPVLGAPTMSATVGAGGTASIAYTLPGGVPSGLYHVHAVYTGDPTHLPAAAPAIALLHIGSVSTTTTVTPATMTVARGSSLQVTAGVSAASGDLGIVGTVDVGNGSNSCTIAAPSGSCDLTFTQLGPATIDAAYTATPPASYLPSTAQAAVTVTCPAIPITPGTLPVAHLNQPYSVRFQAAGGLAPYTFSTSGALPAGLTFSGDTLSGTPTTETSAPFTVQVTEAGGACGGSQVYTLSTGAYEYTLAEGASNSFFRSDISIANPNASDAPIMLTYVSETGATATEARTLTPFSRLTIPTGAGSVAASLGSTFATRVTSSASLPLVVERATYFDGTFHAGDLSSASDGGSTMWAFAEGANGYFHTYLTLGNLGEQTADVTVRYMPEAGAPFDRQYAVAPHSRRTIDTRVEAALAADAFAMTVSSTVPIAADRAQYFGSPFIGAHADSGARALSSDWYFAEGASGSAFDTYLLLGNPSSTDANVTVTYHTDAFDTITKTYVVRAEGRRSISVEVEDPKLAAGSFWIEAHADRPIVAERAMYLVRAGAWTDATDTTGATAPALRWGLAEGIGGPPLGYVPYLLIANPSSAQAASIAVQYLLPTGAPLTHAYAVPALGRLTLDIRAEQPTLIGQQFGIIVSSTNDTPIIVERSLYWTLGTTGFVGAMNSMGTPLPPPPTP